MRISHYVDPRGKNFFEPGSLHHSLLSHVSQSFVALKITKCADVASEVLIFATFLTKCAFGGGEMYTFSEIVNLSP